MHKELVFMWCAIIALILVSTTEAKGGRGGGGRSGGRSSGRSSSSSGRGFFSSGSRSSSSSSFGSGKSSSHGRTHSAGHTGTHTSGGWVHGFFHSTPYHYSYRPIYISRTSTHTGSYHVPTKEEEEVAEHNKDTGNYAIGYSVSKALSNDFFSIFNVVHGISKYPDKIRNKELTTTTTQSPVSTYDLNYVINSPYTTAEPRSYFFDDDQIFGMLTPKKSSDSNENNGQNYDGIQSSVGELDNILKETSTESTTTIVDYVKSNSETNRNSDYEPLNSGNNWLFNTPSVRDYNDNIDKIFRDFQSNMNKNDAPTERTESNISPQSIESINEMIKRLEKNVLFSS